MSQTIQYIIVGGIFAIMILLVICSKVNKKKSGKKITCNCDSCCNNCNILQEQKKIKNTRK